MKKMNLQLFSKPVHGKKLVYLFRILKDAATADGTTLAFTTENSKTISKDSDSTPTKDGNITTPGEMEIEISATALLASDSEMYEKFVEAMKNDELIEIWEANLERPAETGSNKFKGTYYQGYLTEFEETSSAEDYVECSCTFAINGTGATGDVTVTQEQQALADYVFTDTQKTGA